MRITILGVGNAYDADEPNSSVLVERDGFCLLIDCGHSVVPLVWRARPDPEAVDTIFLTHHHADHVLGLPALLDRWSWEKRTKALQIVTTAPGRAQVEQMCDLLQIAPRYPVHYAAVEETRALGPFALRTAPTQHFVPNLALQLKAGGACFAYSGDGRPTEASRALYGEADLLLHECYHCGPAPEDRGHCDLPTARGITGPARIGLYHIKSGEQGCVREAIGGDPRLFVAAAGQTIEL